MSVVARATATCLVADGHPTLAEFLSRALGPSRLSIATCRRDGLDALEAIRETRPSVAVLSARMPHLSGLEVARALAAEGSPTRIVLFTGYGDRALLDEALSLGVTGLLDRDAPLEDLVRAVRLAAEGRVYVDPSLGALLLGRGAGPTLTQREREVLSLLAEGMTNEEIGERLSISPQTVRTHVQKAMVRLGATTRTQAVATALRASLIR